MIEILIYQLAFVFVAAVFLFIGWTFGRMSNDRKALPSRRPESQGPTDDVGDIYDQYLPSYDMNEDEDVPTVTM